MTFKHLPAPMPAGLLALREHLGFNMLIVEDYHAIEAVTQGKLMLSHEVLQCRPWTY